MTEKKWQPIKRLAGMFCTSRPTALDNAASLRVAKVLAGQGTPDDEDFVRQLMAQNPRVQEAIEIIRECSEQDAPTDSVKGATIQKEEKEAELS